MTSIQDYMKTIDGPLQQFTQSILDYMKDTYPKYPLVLFYKQPTLKLKPKRFIMLGGGRNHFSLYTTDFDYVNDLKTKKIAKMKFGKSSILFPLEKEPYLALAYEMIDAIVWRAEHDL